MLIIFVYLEVVIFKSSVLVDLATPIIIGGNSKCSLIPQLSIPEGLLCLKYNRRATGVSVYSVAKQTHMVSIEKLNTNNC